MNNIFITTRMCIVVEAVSILMIGASTHVGTQATLVAAVVGLARASVFSLDSKGNVKKDLNTTYISDKVI